MISPFDVLERLFRQSGSTFRETAAQAFEGDATVETGNGLYRFSNGVFAGRSPKAPGYLAEIPRGMEGLRLVGFLFYADGLWSLSTAFRYGALAVLLRPGRCDARSFVLTSNAVAFRLDPRRVSGVELRSDARPRPAFGRPRRGSTTRIMIPAVALAGGGEG